MTQVKSITIKYIAQAQVGVELPYYVVTKVTDSLEYHPGQTLTKKQAQELCDSRLWKVTVIGNTI